MQVHHTTIVAVRRDGQVAIGGDGQVTFGETVIKQRAKKIRRMHGGKVLAGFAGAAADAITLFQKFEDRLEEHHGNLRRAALELAKDWRTDRVLRRLEAMLVVADAQDLLLISGSGEILEPDEESVIAIGSGGPYAAAAAKAMLRFTKMDAATICKEALLIAASLCVYTNDEITLETLP